MRVLAGDVGGTHARLAVFEVADDGTADRLVDEVFDSTRYDGLVPIVREFMDESVGSLEPVPKTACFGVACPIVDGDCELPNLDWVIERDALAASTGCPQVRLINDFDAVGYGLSHLEESDFAELQRGEPRPGGAIALIGAGTGLGQGYLTWDAGRGRYRVHSSEGGHVDFAPRSDEQAELWAFLRSRFGRVSCERVVSGPGLVNVYEFLVETGRGEEHAEVRGAPSVDEAARAISRQALEEEDATCVRALDVFMAAFGAQAGDLALTIQAEGGLYLAGGIAPDLLDSLREGPFLGAFRDKGRMADLVRSIPVRVVLDEDVGLLGAAVAATLPEP